MAYFSSTIESTKRRAAGRTRSSKKLADNMDSISNIGTKKGKKSPSVGRMHWKRFFDWSMVS